MGVLLIHGYGGSIGDLRPFAEELQRSGYSVFGMRIAGHGSTPAVLAQSNHIDWRESVFRAANFVLQNTPRLIVIGTSFGGALALDYAVHAGAKVAGVMTINTPISYKGGGPLQTVALKTLRLVTPYYRKPGLTVADRKRLKETGSLPAWPVNGILETKAFIRRFVLPALPRLTVPTLVVTSSQDAYVDTKSADAILGRLGSAKKDKLSLTADSHRPWLDPGLRRSMIEKMQILFR